MNMKDLVHFAPTEAFPWFAPVRSALAPSYHQLVAPLRRGILSARQHLLSQQQDDGSWLGRRHGNAALPSQLLLLQVFRGREESRLAAEAIEAILRQQLPAGGWSAVPAGPLDVSISVAAYFALKLAGHAASDQHLSAARTRIREAGGADAADAATRFCLALLGQVDYEHCASGLKQIAHHRPRLVAPLVVVASERVVREVELERGVRELFVQRPCDWPAPGAANHPQRPKRRGRRRVKANLTRSRWDHWDPLFREDADAVLLATAVEELKQAPFEALEFDELVWHAVALEALGMGPGDAAFEACESRLMELTEAEEDGAAASPQPGRFPTVDTALTVRALRASGLEPDSRALNDAVATLAIDQSLGEGSPVELAWCSEALAAVAPAVDAADDALPPRIQMAGSCVQTAYRTPCSFDGADDAQRSTACRVVERLLALQQADGGWGAELIADCGLRIAEWEKTSKRVMPIISADVTGAVLEALARHNLHVGHRVVDRAVEWLRGAQQADGSWDSATGVRFVHGTSLAVCGLVAAGVPGDDAAVAAGVNWLLAHQQASGGWGETIAARPQDPLYHSSAASATQSAWALVALLAAGHVKHEAVSRGVQFLLDTQLDDGRWDEPQFTLRHRADGAWQRSELHSVAWPLVALSRWAVASTELANEPANICLRCFDDEAT